MCPDIKEASNCPPCQFFTICIPLWNEPIGLLKKGHLKASFGLLANQLWTEMSFIAMFLSCGDVMKKVYQLNCLSLSQTCHRKWFMKLEKTYDMHHKKTDLKGFGVVIPIEGWAHVAAPILLLVWHWIFRMWLCWDHRLYSQKVGVMPKEGWVRPRAPILLLVWQRQRP